MLDEEEGRRKAVSGALKIQIFFAGVRGIKREKAWRRIGYVPFAWTGVRVERAEPVDCSRGRRAAERKSSGAGWSVSVRQAESSTRLPQRDEKRRLDWLCT